MPDLSHIIGGDLALSPSGGLAVVDGGELGRQRIIKRLLTNPFADPFNPGYGAGLGQFVGQPGQEQAIQGLVLQQMRAEQVVSQDPGPVVSFVLQPTGLGLLNIAYLDADTGQNMTIAFQPDETGYVAQG